MPLGSGNTCKMQALITRGDPGHNNGDDVWKRRHEGPDQPLAHPLRFCRNSKLLPSLVAALGFLGLSTASGPDLLLNTRFYTWHWTALTNASWEQLPKDNKQNE